MLHIDDDPNDTELLRAATRRAEARFDLQNVEDGEHAMAYLSGVPPYADRLRYPLPSLILLDLKMPRATGFELLKWIRRHPEIGTVPCPAVFQFNGCSAGLIIPPLFDITNCHLGGSASLLR